LAAGQSFVVVDALSVVTAEGTNIARTGVAAFFPELKSIGNEAAGVEFHTMVTSLFHDQLEHVGILVVTGL
jgi:hypothetical protein